MVRTKNVLGLGIILAVMASLVGCASGPQLTPEQQEAQIAWEAANPQYPSARYFRLNVNNDGVIITGYTGAVMDVRIPPQIYGMPVVGIANGAFGRLGLTSVIIPESVTFIGRGGLRGPGAFQGNQLRSIVIPENVTGIGIRAFADNLLTSVDIPDSVTLIQFEAFFGNRIASITAPYNTRVGDRIIGSRVISGDTSGTMGSPYYVRWVRSGPSHSRTNLVEDGDGIMSQVIVGGGAAILITGPVGHSDAIEIPVEINGLPVVAIGGNVADGARIFYNRAFRGSGITSVSIPDSVTSIGRHAFAYNNLSDLTIPDSVRTIGEEAFMRNQLTNVTISSSVRMISSRLFAENWLTDVVIPDGVLSIGNYAFAQNELASVTIPDSVSLIAIRAFANNQLATVDIPGRVHTIMNGAFANNRLTAVDIPGSVHTVMNGAFANNRLTSVNIPSSVRTLEPAAFANNPLTSIVIGEGIGSIHESVFSGALRDVTQISIGANVNLQGNNEIVWRMFRAAYEENGARAGVYTFRDGQWDWHPL